MGQTEQAAGSGNGGAVAPAPPSSGGRSGGAGVGAAAGVSAVVSDAAHHHSVRDIKRGAGQSAVKSAAYITNEPLFDARVGKVFGRPAKSGAVLATGTVGPAGTKWTPADLWSAAEKAETRKNARVAQETILALPHELDTAAHKRLLNGYALHLRDKYGVAATWALHAPNSRGDQRNTHGHILTTTRRAEVGADGRPVLAEKVRALAGHRSAMAAEIEGQRAEWTKRVNAELERAGLSKRLDHRSHARRADAGEGAPGLEPSKHRGATESAKQRRDPRRAAKAAESGKERTARNHSRTAQWQALGGNAQATATLRALDAMSGPDEREAAAAARWQAKQAREHAQWQAEEEAKDRASRGGDSR